MGNPALLIQGDDLYEAGLELENNAKTWRLHVQSTGEFGIAKGDIFTPFRISENTYNNELVLTNIGVGVNTNAPLERLQVNGAVNIGNTTNTNAGTVRWTGSDFEGYDGSLWKSLTSGGGADGDWTVDGANMYSNVYGNVGIGTTDPQFDLDIDGAVNATSYEIPYVDTMGDTVVSVRLTESLLEFYQDGMSGAIETASLDKNSLRFQDANIWGSHGELSVNYLSLRNESSLSQSVLRGAYTHLIGAVNDVYVSADLTDAKVHIVGATSITLDGGNAVPSDDTVILPNDAIMGPEIGDEPGLANDLSNGSITLTGPEPDLLLSQTISVPAPGYVLVVGSCQATANHETGTASGADIGIMDAMTVFPPTQDMWWYLPSSLPDGTYRTPVTVHGLFEATTAGDYTYYFMAQKTDGNITIFDMQLSLVFFATEYGTVIPTLVQGRGVSDEESPVREPMSQAEIMNKRAESIAANTARVERELATMQARLEELKTEMQSLRATSRSQ
jgi:hypothetical protein